MDIINFLYTRMKFSNLKKNVKKDSDFQAFSVIRLSDRILNRSIILGNYGFTVVVRHSGARGGCGAWQGLLISWGIRKPED